MKLYAPTDTGSVIGLDGNDYRIRGGIVDVPDQDVAGLLANGFTIAAGQELPAAEVVEESAKPARKTKGKRNDDENA
jgi:hypothetical protein